MKEIGQFADSKKTRTCQNRFECITAEDGSTSCGFLNSEKNET
jgi:hypothetical protein